MPKARKRRAASRRRSEVKPAKKLKAGLSAASPPAPPSDPPPKPRRAARTKAKPAAAKRSKAPAQRRRAAAAKPKRQPLATPAVIALPYCPEPLVEPEPAIDLAAWSALAPPQAAPPPLPRSRALAHRRSAGLLVAIADWLGTRTQQLWRRLEQTGQRDKHARRGLKQMLGIPRRFAADGEVTRLRAENERLRLQLEALLALQTHSSERPGVPQA